MAMEITQRDFESSVLQAPERVLLDFYAPWCTPCKMLAPVLDEVEREAADCSIYKINVDEEPLLAERFQVMGVPTLVLMEGGRAVDKRVGFQPKEQILALLEGRG